MKLEIRQQEREYLRELAKKLLEYANLTIMDERRKLWYKHNVLKGEQPVIVMENMGFIEEILPSSRCETSAAKEIERNLLIPIMNHECINDDKVISPYYEIYWRIGSIDNGIETKREFAIDSDGRALGYADRHPITDLKRDLSSLKRSNFHVDREGTLTWKNFVDEVIGDILPTKMKNESFRWHATPSQKAVQLMGLEPMMFAMMDYPDDMHALYRFLVDDILAFVKWQEKEGLLELNNENDYAGAGSYGFTDELPTNECKKSGHITTKDLWVNMNSQETVGISPAMYGEYIYPYYEQIAKEFGLVYYGCCEPVHTTWNEYVSKLQNLRKVSISPWCDEEFMGNALSGKSVIYSRKPSPNFIGVKDSFDQKAFSEHISKTLKAAKDCKLEFIFRDSYTLSGDLTKPAKAVQITRNLIEEMW